MILVAVVRRSVCWKVRLKRGEGSAYGRCLQETWGCDRGEGMGVMEIGGEGRYGCESAGGELWGRRVGWGGDV